MSVGSEVPPFHFLADGRVCRVLCPQTGKRVWKVCGFPGTVHHILPVKLFRRASMSRLRRDVVATDAILTWSDDNVVRLWNMLVSVVHCGLGPAATRTFTTRGGNAAAI